MGRRAKCCERAAPDFTVRTTAQRPAATRGLTISIFGRFECAKDISYSIIGVLYLSSSYTLHCFCALIGDISLSTCQGQSRTSPSLQRRPTCAAKGKQARSGDERHSGSGPKTNRNYRPYFY